MSFCNELLAAVPFTLLATNLEYPAGKDVVTLAAVDILLVSVDQLIC